jgi:hypothetical protein
MRRARFASLSSIGLALALAACGGGTKADEKATTKTDEKTDAKGDEKTDAKETAKAEKAEPLTEEELRLIEADPKDLSPDERRSRAYALRKKIMQNPDSAAAQAIMEGKEAIERGEVELPPHLIKDGSQSSSGQVLSAPAPKNEPTGLQR